MFQVHISGIPPCTTTLVETLCLETAGAVARVLGDTPSAVSHQSVSTEREAFCCIDVVPKHLQDKEDSEQRRRLREDLENHLHENYPNAAVRVHAGQPIDLRREALWIQ